MWHDEKANLANSLSSRVMGLPYPSSIGFLRSSNLTSVIA
jgi:hypothetical protein